jgi:phage major head subunit gpT-like protein
MGAEASRDAVWLDMVIDVLRDPPVWVDGIAFFKNDRVYGSQTIDNFLGAALTRANLKTAISLMLGYKGNQGKSLKVSPFMLLCGATIFWTAKELMESENLIESAVTVTNDVRGICAPRFHPALDADEWYLLGVQGSYKPAAAQIRKEGNVLDRKDNATDDNVFWDKEYVYGADCRGAGFLPFPHLVVRGYRSGTSGAKVPAAPAPEAPAAKPPKK